jgi:hypothetical protein
MREMSFLKRISVHTFKTSHPVAGFDAAQRAVNFLVRLKSRNGPGEPA